MTDRQRALTVIGDVCDSNSFLKDALNDIYDRNKPTDPSYLWRVTKGVVERLIELDIRISALSSMKLKRMHPMLRNTLRLGAYEILYMDSIPIHATVNECVNLIKHSPAARAKGMANAILRRIADAPVPGPLSGKSDPLSNISARYSIPLWLAKLWNERYGTDWLRCVGEAFLNEQPLTLRVNSLMISRDRLLGIFADNGISAAEHPLSEYALLLLQKSPVTSLPGYEEGLFYVQDIGSVSVCEIAGIKPGDSVLDLCAAPGGKSLFAAELTGTDGIVTALDISKNRIERLNENIRRGGYNNITTGISDATVYNDSFCRGFDVVLADVPCSGLGVTGRKPEIKYRLSPDDIAALSSVQKKILFNASRYVKPGGRLVYSTCTLSPSENEDQIKGFVSECPNYNVTDEKLFVPGKEQYNSDGFYICVMQQSAPISLE